MTGEFFYVISYQHFSVAHYQGQTENEKSGNATKPAIFTTGVLEKLSS